MALGFAMWGAASGCGLPGDDLFAYHPRGDAGAQGGAGQGGAASSSGDSVTTVASSAQSSSAVSSSSSSSSGPASSSSGALCPNGVCDPGETNGNCPEDCAPQCNHGPCEPGSALSASCDSCAADVCPVDPFCCTDNWDEQCVEEANELCGNVCCGDGQCSGETCRSCPNDCGVCPTAPTCPHTVCFVGEPLDGADCHATCVAEVCAQDASCCGGNGQGWDGECQSLASLLCGGPHPCIVSVCAQMPSCCEGSLGGGGGAGGDGGGNPTPAAWTQACVDLAKTLCNTTCNCPHSVCGQGSALAPGCNPCAAAVCEADSFCCTNQWDGLCADEAQTICGIDCI